MHLSSHVTHTLQRKSILTDLVDKRGPPGDDLNDLRILIAISCSKEWKDLAMDTPTIPTLGPHIVPLVRAACRAHIGQFEMNKPLPSLHRSDPRAGIVNIGSRMKSSGEVRAGLSAMEVGLIQAGYRSFRWTTRKYVTQSGGMGSAFWHERG